MSTKPFSCVVDASVAAQLYLPESLTSVATTLFGMLAVDPSVNFHVPDLFFIECANIFWKYARRGGCSENEATAALENIASFRLHHTPTSDLMFDALLIAIRHDITAYDACYVALAQRHDVFLITSDKKLVTKLSGSPYSLTWLGAWSPPAPPHPE